ncbi:NUDIX domain-containing protein [Methylovulum sp.]|uniref:NUDIX domain-containing protein n=1 Tax=Methylovulum sp. TaxID=1916980 RepID=UPI0026165108|nr:NUDIX domain-containing protein [Methylovulum sp.]MDD5125572.1 NUDIX domain-containing protein [Methylovulum sp.]
MKKEFSILNKEILYDGFFRLEKYRLKHTLYAGGWSAELGRELFVRGECVGVLLYDPHTDQVVLIEQFRVGALQQPERAWLVEIVAGAIEEGETAVETAYREALEEAGCAIEELLEISRFYTTPGACAERLTLFCGKVDSTNVGGIHGLDEEHEDILVRAVDFADAYKMLETCEIDSAIPIIALQWLALNRTTLRRRWGVAG